MLRLFAFGDHYLPDQPADPPTIEDVDPADRIHTAGEALSIVVTGAVYDESVPQWLLEGPAGMVLTPNSPGDGQATVAWTPGADQVRDEAYAVTVSIFDAEGREASAIFSVRVVAAAARLLSVALVATIPASLNLTDAEIVDYVLFGHRVPVAPEVARDIRAEKAGVSLIGALELLPGTAEPINVTATNLAPGLTFTDGATTGTSIEAGADVRAGLGIYPGGVLGRGFRIPVVSSVVGSTKTFVIVNGQEATTPELVAKWSDDAGEPVVLQTALTGNRQANRRIFEITHQSMDAEVGLVIDLRFASTTGQIILSAIYTGAGGGGGGGSVSVDKVLTIPVHEPLEAVVEYDGTDAVDLVAEGMPLRGSFVDNEDNTGLFRFSTGSAPTSNPAATILFRALKAGAEVAKLAADLTVTAATGEQPVITSTATWSLTVGVEGVKTLVATGEAPIGFSPVTVPGSCVLEVPNVLRWTPEAGDVGTHEFVAIAVDASGRTKFQTITATVS